MFKTSRVKRALVILSLPVLSLALIVFLNLSARALAQVSSTGGNDSNSWESGYVKFKETDCGGNRCKVDIKTATDYERGQSVQISITAIPSPLPKSYSLFVDAVNAQDFEVTFEVPDGVRAPRITFNYLVVGKHK